MEKKCEKGYKLKGGKCVKPSSQNIKTVYGIRYWLVGLFIGSIIGLTLGITQIDRYLSFTDFLGKTFGIIFGILFAVIIFGGFGASIGVLINKFTKK